MLLYFYAARVRPAVHTHPAPQQSFSKTLFKAEGFKKRRVCKIALHWRIVDGKDLIRCQSEIPLYKFFRRSVD